MQSFAIELCYSWFIWMLICSSLMRVSKTSLLLKFLFSILFVFIVNLIGEVNYGFHQIFHTTDKIECELSTLISKKHVPNYIPNVGMRQVLWNNGKIGGFLKSITNFMIPYVPFPSFCLVLILNASLVLGSLKVATTSSIVIAILSLPFVVSMKWPT